MGPHHLTKTNRIRIEPVWHVFELEPWAALHIKQLTIRREILITRSLAPYSPYTSVAGVAARWLHNLVHFESDAFITVHPIQADVSMIHLKKQVISNTTPQRVDSVGSSKVGSHGLRVVIHSCDLSLQDSTARIEDLIYRSLIAVSLTIDLQPWADHQHFGLVVHKTVICVVPSRWYMSPTRCVEDMVLSN